MTLLIDNYDSFSYNLFQFVGEIDPDIKVIRNDEMTVREIEELSPDRIIISPGPGRPEDAGIITEAAVTVCRKIPTLGVCLGHQAICMAYGAVVTYARKLMHGKTSSVRITADSPIFDGLPERIDVARYHSLAADPDTLPDCLTVTAITDDGEIMAVQHREYPIYGVQFHPESIMTPMGKNIIYNFIKGGHQK
ncbi:MAG: aminodeoxychorismate/anthranilate synthase component II [Oscillospiraceae bacterium]|nr:aminodeoxychorismate/anthranilate synthase component II [Oscillospiraceae bacterium]MBQ8978174.1 aminodeoxychorismate/anthranilate synthase component II [Oscillospiraceae bacterium]